MTSQGRAVAQPELEVEPEIGPPEAVPDNSPIKPEFRQAPAGLDPLGSLRPRQLAAVPPAQADLMGAVPKNVIDTGAMNAQTQRRLGPVMANMERSMPEAYRGAAEANDQAAAGLALPADKTLKAALEMRAPADAAIAREREHEFDVEKEGAKAKAERDKPLTRPQVEGLAGQGFKKGERTAKTAKVADAIERTRAAEGVADILTNPTNVDDKMIVFNITRMLGSIGAQSNNDLKAALGLDSMSVPQLAVAKFQELVHGGMPDKQKKAILGIIDQAIQEDNDKVHGYLDALDEAAAAETDPEVLRGWQEFRKTIPKEYRDLHDADKEKRETQEEPEGVDDGDEPESPSVVPVGSAASNDADFDEALDSAAADHGVDPDKMRGVIGPESTGRGNAKNPHSSASGIIQMIDEVAVEYVNPRTGKKFKNAAELRGLSREEQAPIAAKYFADKGLDEDSPPEDYALAVAAPAFVGKSANRDAVVYPEGSDKHAINKPWWPKDGGDITVGSILDFYARNRKGAARAETPASSKPAAGGQAAARAKLLEGL